jgi:kynurenine formamidase
MEQIAKESGIVFRPADILFVRIGMTKEWDTVMTAKQKEDYAANPSPSHAGIEATKDVLRWIWDNQFSAVASDAISWEVYPRTGDLFLHEYLLAGWGMPIGEMFDLEALSRLCAEENRWTFFVASAPLNMPGGVSSPPNCIAIF